jgi:hypothetical protein
MPDMQYNTEDLRTGGKHAVAASDSADQAASALKGAQPGGSPFGNVNGADALHGAVGTAQQHHSVAANTASRNLNTASVRANGAAGLGDDNTEETTHIAPRSANASTVTNGM